MNLLHLQYFQRLAKNENATKTAQELYISQPALSKTIRQLEKELGVELFDREGKRLRLNENGRLFLEHVDRILMELDVGKKELSEMNLNRTEKISFLFNRKFEKVNQLIYDYWKRHPEVMVSYKQGQPEDAYEKLLQNEIDFALVSQDIVHTQIESKKLGEHEFYAFLGKGHPLSGENDISIKDLRSTKFICNEYSYGKEELVKLCRQYEYTPQIVFETADADMIRSIMNDKPYCFLARSNVVYHVLTTAPDCAGTFHCIKEHIRVPDYLWLRKEIPLSEEKEKFLEYVLQEFSDYDIQTHSFVMSFLQ